MTALPPFTLHRPKTVSEATRLLDDLGDQAALYAGGTELLLLFKLGFAEFGHLIDVKRIDELRGITDEDGWLRIGAAVTHRELEHDAAVLEHCPPLAAMERRVGNLRVRTMGSIGGNLCFADPHSDPATFLLAAGGRVEARRGENEARTIDVGEFVVGPYENSLEGGEVLTAVLVPKLAPGASLVHRKIAFHERPAITVSCHLRAEDGSLNEVRIAVGSAGAVPARAREAEEMLRDHGPREPDPDPTGELGRLVADAADPVEDADGSVEYKRHLVGVLTRRCVASALSQAGT